MYDIEKHFEMDYSKAVGNESAIIKDKGSKYRFTIITESLVRIEYSENMEFEDRPTSVVWFRNHGKPNFQIKEDQKYIEIETKYFSLFYIKGKPIKGSKINPSQNFRIKLKGTDKVWYYNHPEVRNYGTSGTSLEDKAEAFKKGLFSGDGFISIDDTKSMIFKENGMLEQRKTTNIDTYVFMYNKDFGECLRSYFMITGYPALIPRYALGNWWSKNEDYNDLVLKKLVDDFGANNIPLSVLLLNNSWHKSIYNDKKVSSGFSFNKDNFKNPEAMVKYLHQNGIRIGLLINPKGGIYPFEDKFQEALEYIEANKNGIIPFNVYDSTFLAVYFKVFIHFLEEKEVDFYWIEEKFQDNNELFAMSHYQFCDMSRDYKTRPMLLTRNASICEHRYPVLYSGKTKVSWETLAQIPLFTAAASNKGVSFWSHDIGGFSEGIEDSELYTRFVQLGVFSPILRLSSEGGKYYKRAPWLWGVKTYSIVKDYLHLRHRLIPYLYTESYKYHKFGTPLVQPLYYRNPEMYDDIIYKNEYFLGSELFVCPILNKKDYVMNRVVHRFYMPVGTWYDFVTGKKFIGSRNYVSFFKDEEYPVFAKSGAIIVLGENPNINDTTPPKSMEIQIFPGTNNVYELYEDDGVSDLYRKDFFLKTKIEYNYLPNNYTVIIRSVEGKSNIVPEVRKYKIRFRNTKKTNDISIFFNDTPIKTYMAYKDKSDFVVEVEGIKTIGQLTINCKGKDIEIDAVRIINEDISGIISDLQIETKLKEVIDSILFNELLTIKKKRIKIRKLRKQGLKPEFIKVFLKLLEYVGEV